MNPSWIKVILMIVTVLMLMAFVVIGGYGLSKNGSSIVAYGVLGLGLGGLIALVGAWREFKRDKNSKDGR